MFYELTLRLPKFQSRAKNKNERKVEDFVKISLFREHFQKYLSLNYLFLFEIQKLKFLQKIEKYFLLYCPNYLSI